jgi:acyl-coenzyme A synthetase/AMP-(fatty) acid ligase
VAAPIPLTDRAPDAVLFHLPERNVTVARFVAEVQALAHALPPATHVMNLCTGRYSFALGFAAALLRGQTSLLASDRSPDALRALSARFPGAYALTDAGDPLPVPAVTVSASSCAAPSGSAMPAIPGEQAAAIVFTSGSTGMPVAHGKTWLALAERSRDAGAAFGLVASTPVTIVGTVPPQHMYGFEATVLLPLHAPAATWCGPAFYPADIRAALEAASAPRLLVTTPLQLRALLASASMPAIARVISATAPLDPAMAQTAERQWDTIVSEIFGATEVGSIAFRRTTEGETWTSYSRVRLSGVADGLLVEAPGMSATVLDDAVDLLPGGGFRLLGRRSDVVKLGGRRASLSGLNRALAAVEGVEDGAFLPPPADDHHAGARMTAFVVAPGRGGDAILAALRDRIDPVFLPRRIVHVDRLPRNELGKLPLGALLALQAGS